MHTPAMDRLAATGTSFRQAFAPGATCVASRAAIFTGRFAPQSGVYSFMHWAHHPNWVQDLAAAGYHCASIGKMHFMPIHADGGFHERVIVENPADRPGERDDDWGLHLATHGQQRPLNRSLSDPDWFTKFQGIVWPLEEELHPDVFVGEKAVQWLAAHPAGEQPVFLQVGFTGPHEPYDPLQRHYELYRDAAVPEPVFADGELDHKPPQQRAHRDFFAGAKADAAIRLEQAGPDDFRRMRRHYYGKISTVDEQLGRVMSALQEQGYLDNALVIFCSDHGDMLGDHRLPYKWLMYEPSVHVPLVMWDTRRRRQQAEVADLVSLIDLGPTVLEAAGLQAPTHYAGRSLLGYLGQGQKPAPANCVFACDNYQTMVRGPRFKMVHYLHQDLGELYDLQSDPHELDNRWQDPAMDSVKRQLKEALLEWTLECSYRQAGYLTRGWRNYRLRDPRVSPRLHGDGAVHRLDPPAPSAS